ncbi:MAG: CPBP family intramembrane glutamic endopeptidase [Bdellovibrionota bacterium]
MNNYPYRDLKWPIGYIILVLVLSYAFTAYAYFSADGLKHFNYIMFIPALCAIVFRLLQKRNLSSLLEPIRAIPNIKSLVFSILYPVCIIFICALIAQVTGLATIDWEKLGTSISGFSVLQFVWAIAFVTGEEYGWRGYLLPELNKVMGPIISASIVGIIWAIWHGPLVYILATVMGAPQSPLLLTLVQMTVVFLFSLPFAYSYFISGSIIPPIIIHFVWNWINPDILGNIYRNRPGLAQGDIFIINGEGVIGAIVATGFFLWFVFKFPRKAT